MEKRANQRHNLKTPVVCSYLTSCPSSGLIEGIVKNCCRNGVCAELQAYFKAGTVVVIRITGRSCGYTMEEGFRSLALAEVKWSKPKSVGGHICYATGLRYVMI